MIEHDADLPLVTAVTVFHNRAETVQKSLGSLLRQTYPRLEIIAVNDGSSDNTWSEMQRFGDARLRLVSRPNAGFTKSMIWMIEQARGSIIAVHDAGDISFPERLARQVEVLRTNLNVGVVACKVLNPVIGTGRIKVVGHPNGLRFHDELLTHNMFTHGEVTFRKDLYRQAGGYRPIFRFAQDLDLWLRMSRLTDYHTIQEILYERFEIPGSVSASPDKVLHQQRFSELARQCAEIISSGGKDLVDQYEDDAFDHLSRSDRLGEKLMRNAYRTAFRAKDRKGGAMLAKSALQESKSLRNIAACAAITIAAALFPETKARI